jgi:hypothetical protein
MLPLVLTGPRQMKQATGVDGCITKTAGVKKAKFAEE